MGLSDRDYMRVDSPKRQAGPPRPHVRRAQNTPAFWARLRFWLWSLKNRK